MHRRIFAVNTFICLLTLSVLIIFSAKQTFAAFPLITSHAGTQGQGYLQIDIPGEYGQDSEATITTKISDLSATLTHGIIDTAEISVGIQFAAWHCNASGAEPEVTGGGIGDLSLDVKRTFYEKEGLSCAFKPSVAFTAGDDSRGLCAPANPVISSNTLLHRDLSGCSGRSEKIVILVWVSRTVSLNRKRI